MFDRYFKVTSHLPGAFISKYLNDVYFINLQDEQKAFKYFHFVTSRTLSALPAVVVYFCVRTIYHS